MTMYQSPPEIASANKVSAFPTSLRDERTAIIVPCYNEAERLNSDAFLRYIETTRNIEFVFVNDGSQDATEAKLKALQSQRPDRISVLSLSHNSGKAEAVRQGLLFAIEKKSKLLGYWDADLATPLDAIDDFIHVARRCRVSIIFGSRRQLLGHRIERTFWRRSVSRICAVLARQAVRLPIGDTQCGAKLFRNTPELRSELEEPFTAGWLFDVELFARLSHRLGNRKKQFYELPLCQWSEIEGSKVTTSAILKSGLNMLRIIAEVRLGFPALNQTSINVPDVQVVGHAETPSIAAA